MDRTDAQTAETAVLRQVYAYCAAVDAHDLTGLSDVLDPDVVLETAGVHTGRDEVLGFFEACFPKMAPTLHFVANAVVDVTSPTTAMSTALFLVISGGSSSARSVAGRYRDELRQVDGQWRFTHKVHEVALESSDGVWRPPEGLLPWVTRP
jgi:ketosteroid isomerase-like protein